MNENVCSFFAILKDDSVRKINLTQNITPNVRDAFIDNAWDLSDEGLEQIEFDGSYVLQDGEIFFVSLELPANITEAVQNPFGVGELDLRTDTIKTLFWYENGVYYLQNFDTGRLLSNKNVFFYSDNTYHKLTQNAFIIGDNVDGICVDNRFYFSSYRNGNRIFSLLNIFEEATNADLSDFSIHVKIDVNLGWLQANSDTIIRKQITLIQKAGILETAEPAKLSRKARKFDLTLNVQNGKIIFPCNKKECKAILNFLNEQYYIGAITGTKYVTNSKRPIS
jgi:hypothetical protein